MTRRNLTLFGLALLLGIFVASFQHFPGYMDADYYLMGAEQLVAGNGFQEMVLWNYLDSPSGLPHPSHSYWMPGVSLLGVAALLFSPNGGFDQAQWVFILLAALVPPLTASLADRTYAALPTHRRNRAAWLAGLLALASGYYLGFLTTTDSFGLVMVLGSLILILISSDRISFLKAFSFGILAGLLNLTRADGILWFFIAVLVVVQQKSSWRQIFAVPLGYLLVMAPWFLRNLSAFGALLPPGTSLALWWTKYDDLFAYPAELLTPGRWLGTGLAGILGARLEAGWQNVQSAVAVGGMVFLFPLVLVGLWRLRGLLPVRMGVLAWGMVFFLMSIVFPFAGARGGYFHSASTLQPLFWAVVPAGLDGFVEWGGRVRGWRIESARRVFGVGLVILAGIISSLLMWVRVIEPAASVNRFPPAYLAAEALVEANASAASEIVMVNNPPGFFRLTDRPAIVIPDGGLKSILMAASRFDARFLILGPEQGLAEIYEDPEGNPGLRFLGVRDGLQIYAIESRP